MLTSRIQRFAAFCFGTPVRLVAPRRLMSEVRSLHLQTLSSMPLCIESELRYVKTRVMSSHKGIELCEWGAG